MQSVCQTESVEVLVLSLFFIGSVYYFIESPINVIFSSLDGTKSILFVGNMAYLS